MILQFLTGESLTSIAALIGIGVGVHQYYRAQIWKKSEFAAAQLQKLSDDPDLALCCVFLDWGARRIAVPQKYAVFDKDNEAWFVHDWGNVKDSLIPAPKEVCNETHFKFPLVLYRDMFDKFFAYLDRIDHYINVGLFKVEDVYPMRYWLNQIKATAHLAEQDQKVFLDFCDSYGYPGVRALIDKFDLEEEKMAAGMKPRRN